MFGDMVKKWICQRECLERNYGWEGGFVSYFYQGVSHKEVLGKGIPKDLCKCQG